MNLIGVSHWERIRMVVWIQTVFRIQIQNEIQIEKAARRAWISGIWEEEAYDQGEEWVRVRVRVRVRMKTAPIPLESTPMAAQSAESRRLHVSTEWNCILSVGRRSDGWGMVKGVIERESWVSI